MPRRQSPLAAAVATAALLASLGAACGTTDQAAVGPSHSASTSTSAGPSTPVSPTPSPRPPQPIPESLLGQDVERIPTSRRVVALTFDAGANADAVPSILATLAGEHVTATFFLTGDFVQRFPDAARSIVASGHRLGNHSVDHPAFTSLTDGETRDQVLGAEEQISSVTGHDPRPLFRFPLGDRDARTIAAVNGLGYVAVRWTVDSLGWQGVTGGRSADEVTDRVLSTAEPGQIVLMHVGSHPADGSMLDADALPDVIAGLRRAGYEFVTLDALFTAGAG